MSNGLSNSVCECLVFRSLAQKRVLDEHLELSQEF